MATANPIDTTPQSKRFLYLYALAVSGGTVAYMPFLTILLPNKATLLVGDGALSLLAHLAFAGAIAASLANIMFGWASDKSGLRRPWILAGLIVSCGVLPAMQFASSELSLILLIVGWQFGLNMMLAPLSAWAGDCVPDSQKGLLGGLLSCAPALGATSGALITLPGFASENVRLIIVALLVVAMVAPVLFLGRPTPMPQLCTDKAAADGAAIVRRDGRNAVVRMWIARLFVQIAEASLFAFLLLWFRSVVPDFGDNDVATLFAVVLAMAVVATFAIGRWSDRNGKPIRPLSMCAAVAAIGLLVMSAANGLGLAVVGYVVFGLSSGVFLALHSSQTLRVLITPKTRGRDLGLFNLTNTVPSLIMPWLTLAMVPVYGFDALFLLLAGLAVAACLLLTTMPDGARKSRTQQ